GDNLDILVGAISREILEKIKIQILSDKKAFSFQIPVKISERHCHKILDQGIITHLYIGFLI
ncbi:MAG: hypothetical protein ACI8RA_002745, partial [Chlamydiales bacterium]